MRYLLVTDLEQVHNANEEVDWRREEGRGISQATNLSLARTEAEVGAVARCMKLGL